MKKGVLFITHDANRTGAPILLLNLIRILNAAGYKINTLIKNPEGPLISDFEKASARSMTFYRKRPASSWIRLWNRLSGVNTYNDIGPCLENVQLIISNTLTNGDMLPYLKKRSGAPLITYAHELEVATKTFTGPESLEDALACSDALMVPSEAVKIFLLKQLNVAENKIHPLNYYIPENSTDLSRTNASVFTIGACGTPDWRKGFDIFLLVARKVLLLKPQASVHFLWKGITKATDICHKALYDIRRLGLSGKIELLEASGNTNEFYARLDLFILTSREDPYPLVVLEAAALGIPTVGFDEAGGAVEFIGTDAGTTVPYLSAEDMARAILRYYSQREILMLHGKNASRKLHALHQDKALILQQFESACKSVL